MKQLGQKGIETQSPQRRQRSRGKLPPNFRHSKWELGIESIFWPKPEGEERNLLPLVRPLGAKKSMSQPQKRAAEVFVLFYLRPKSDGSWVGIFIGVYSSVRTVEAAIDRLRPKPDYRDYPDGFKVDCYRLDEEYDDQMSFNLWKPMDTTDTTV
jgi:hypothetical protein